MSDIASRFTPAGGPPPRRPAAAPGVGRRGSSAAGSARPSGTPHADVPDDSALRLVVLPPEQWFTKDDPRPATDAAAEHLRTHGGQPRHRANRLLFLAADHAVLARLRDATRMDARPSAQHFLESGRGHG